jgi:hypothetical protein
MFYSQLYAAFCAEYLDELSHLSDNALMINWSRVQGKFQCDPDRYEYYMAHTASIEFVRNHKVCCCSFAWTVFLCDSDVGVVAKAVLQTSHPALRKRQTPIYVFARP